MRKSKRGEIARAKQEELEHKIEGLVFYNQSYLLSAMQTIAYVVPQLVTEVRGSSDKLGRALNLLEQVSVATEKRIKELQSLRVEPKQEGK